MRLANFLLSILAVLLFWNFTACDKGKDTTATEKKAEAGSPAPRGTIVCIGDSLTEGYGLPQEQAYPAILKERLARDGYPYRVINAGISGETSSGTLSRLDWIIAQKPDIVILEIGANDGLRGTDTEFTRKNITAIVQRLKAERVIVILAGMEMLRNLGVNYTTAFREIYTRVAAEEHISRIPFFLEGVAGNPRLNLPDGIHPTAEGYQIILEKIYPYVLEAVRAYEKRAHAVK